MFSCTCVYHAIHDSPAKVIVLQGGTSSSKTISALQELFEYCVYNPGKVVTVTGESIPNLKKGAYRDSEWLYTTSPFLQSKISFWNKSERVIQFQNGSLIEFISNLDEQGAKAGKRDRLFVDEANGISWSIFFQLAIRTRDKIIISYNPTGPFWAHEKLIGKSNNNDLSASVELIISDHRHNSFLSQDEHDKIEGIRDPELFRVYARGKTGKVSGLIFGHYKKTTEWPEKPERIIWGIDYGYTNDETALMKIAVVGRQRYHRECCYEPGLSAESLKAIMLQNGWEDGQVMYSEADPNMINQLRALRVPVYPAIKGPGSEAASISKVKEYDCYYTEDSLNFEKEIMNWKWVEAEDILTGKKVLTNVPMKGGDHLCDAARYAIYTDSFRHR